MAGLKASCRRNGISCLQSTPPRRPQRLLTSPDTPSRARVQVSRGGPSPNLDLLLSTPCVAHPFLFTGPQPLQIKQNTRSLKMSALNSLQLFPLRASPSVRGKHVANPQGEGRGARGVRAGGPRPAPCPTSSHRESLGDARAEPPTLCSTHDFCDSGKGGAVLL